MKKILLLFSALLLLASTIRVQAAETPPEGFISLYSLTYVGMPQTDQTGTVGAVSSKQLVGPGAGWNSGKTYYDISKYDSLSFKFTFNAADAGKQIAVRAAFNKTGTVDLFRINLPNDGSTSFVYNISLAGKTSLDGMFFYNGAKHFSFTYTAATTQAINIDYIALKTVIPTALDVAPMDSLLASALP